MYYFRPNKDSTQELEPEFVVNILICTVRAVDGELPYCFEIISPNRRVYTLQAESLQDRQEWMDVINNCTEYMLSAQASGSNVHKRNMSIGAEQQANAEKQVNMTKLRALNNTCADCNDTGIFVTIAIFAAFTITCFSCRCPYPFLIPNQFLQILNGLPSTTAFAFALSVRGSIDPSVCIYLKCDLLL